MGIVYYLAIVGNKIMDYWVESPYGLLCATDPAIYPKFEKLYVDPDRISDDFGLKSLSTNL
jgi:hypothetical protein